MPIFLWLLIIPAVSLVVINLLWWADSKQSPDRNVVQHVVALATGLVLIAGSIVAGVIIVGAGEAKAEPPDDSMKDKQIIEASLARKTTKQTQPQKEFRPPDEVKQPEGVSHDEKKKPEDKPKKEEPPKPKHPDDPPVDIKDLKDRFKHASDDDPVGKPTTQIGEFNGSEHGFANVTKGDPYLQALIADMAYTPPAIAKDEGTPIGCLHLAPDGKIPETKFEQSTTGDFQTAAEIALAQLKKTRNADPKPVPDNLLPLTTKWLCFKFTAEAK